MPKFEHDCERCLFLGEYTDKDTPYDLYFCEQKGGFGPTVIARFSSDGPDYISGMAFVGMIPALTEAHRIAKERGLIA